MKVKEMSGVKPKKRERGLRVCLNWERTLKAERRETRRWCTWEIQRHGVHIVGPLLTVNLRLVSNGQTVTAVMVALESPCLTGVTYQYRSLLTRIICLVCIWFDDDISNLTRSSVEWLDRIE